MNKTPMSESKYKQKKWVEHLLGRSNSFIKSSASVNEAITILLSSIHMTHA